MSIDRYIQERSAREPRFAHEVAVARSELDLATSLVRWRHDRRLTLGQIAELTGMTEERVQAIEDGGGMTVSEVLWFAQALNIVVSISPNFCLTLSPASPSVRYSQAS
jgi:hypothetical protein